MSRSIRIEYQGAIYHLTSRGNAKGNVFYEDGDKQCFLTTLADVINRYNWICHSYCLMSNHYHLLIETQEPNLSRGMRQLNGVYTMRFNKTHFRVGHLFQGRYKGIIIDRENYLLELCRYIVLNPVRAKMVTRPEDYFWSSYRATIAIQQCPLFLTPDWILSQFGKQRATARKKYIEFVYAGIGGANPWGDLRGQIILGKENFLKSIEKLIEEKANIAEFSRAQRFVSQKITIDFVALAKTPKERNRAIYELHYKNGIAINQVAKMFSLHPSTVSKIISRHS